MDVSKTTRSISAGRSQCIHGSSTRLGQALPASAILQSLQPQRACYCAVQHCWPERVQNPVLLPNLQGEFHAPMLAGSIATRFSRKFEWFGSSAYCLYPLKS